MYNTISAEERNVPAVAIINEGFVRDALSAASSRSMPPIRFVPTTVPCECTVIEEIEAGIEAALEDIIKALTTPLTDDEKTQKQKKQEEYPRITFKGSLDDVNQFYYKRGWTDGFPIVPPTEAKVTEMLSGTDLEADTLLGKLLPRHGKVTVEKIAVNAVVAGALPTYMPALIAGTKLLLESEMGFQGFCTFGVSTGSWAPFWVINGPIRKDIMLNSGSGALSPGNMANAVIGRAMGLIIKNIGGIRKGIEDMGVMGNPMKYTMVIGENEESSPWDPMHTDFGFTKKDNTIAISYPQSYVQHWPESSDDEGILRSIMNYLHSSMTTTLLIPPTHAKSLAKAGWTKDDIKQFLYEYARVPASRKRLASGDRFAKLFKGKISARETDTIPVIRDIRTLRIIVAGGPGAFIGQVTGGGPTPGKAEITKIELPDKWDKLVAKYKNMIPNHIEY